MVENRNIIVVSGLPRSGTSMMMSVLEAGGLEILTDRLRQADAHNPNGYYEYEPVKRLRDGDTSWLSNAVGKAVKIISGLITYLPPDYVFKVIFMQRDLHEILASQKKMLDTQEKKDEQVPEVKMQEIFRKHLQQVKQWISERSNMQVLYVNYNEVVYDPADSLSKINAFLSRDMNLEKMSRVIDQQLYRERKV